MLNPLTYYTLISQLLISRRWKIFNQRTFLYLWFLANLIHFVWLPTILNLSGGYLTIVLLATVILSYHNRMYNYNKIKNMRGSVFYAENRLHVREQNLNYTFHREMLNRIKKRQKSTLRKHH